MEKRELKYEEILQIVDLFKSSAELSEFRLKYGITELDLRKYGAAKFSTGESSTQVITESPVAAPPFEVPEPQELVKKTKTAVGSHPSVTTSSKAFPVKSLTVGTFYCAPEPGAAPFVTVGQRVTVDTTVCIVEVMKLMTAIQANCSGVVSQILVRDGEPVEFGQTLMVIDQD